jgi:hypothetical protein
LDANSKSLIAKTRSMVTESCDDTVWVSRTPRRISWAPKVSHAGARRVTCATLICNFNRRSNKPNLVRGMSAWTTIPESTSTNSPFFDQRHETDFASAGD